MIDIHHHGLFGVDDGAQTIEDSILMIDQAIENNITDIILTPHYNVYFKNRDKIEENFETLKEKVKDKPINLYLGYEARYNMNDSSFSDKRLNNTRFLLLEFSTRRPTDVEEISYTLSTQNIIPIIAHIERYHYLNKSSYYDIKSHSLIQVNADAILGKAFNKKDTKIARFLLKKRLVDFVASDAHNTTDRRNDMLKAYQFVSKKYGTAYADKIFRENAEKIIK